MATSSVSTYLDVTQAATRGNAPTQESDVDGQLAAQAAKVLAAVHGGTEVPTELPAKTELSTEQVLAALAWLSRAGLVDLVDQDGSLHARLTEPARAALSSA
jgi:hypothetical protein